MVPKKVSARKTFFSPAQFSFESEECFRTTHRGKKSWKEIFSTIIQNTHHLTISKRSKNNKSSPSRHAQHKKIHIFPHRKLKNLKLQNHVSKRFEYFFEKVSQLNKSHSAIKSSSCACKTLWFVLKNEGKSLCSQKKCEKNRIVPKNFKGGPFGLPQLFQH